MFKNLSGFLVMSRKTTAIGQSTVLSNLARRCRLERFVLASLVLCTPLAAGCISTASIQDWNYIRVNKSRANSAWKAMYTRSERVCQGDDFEAGFKAGFLAAATGDNCQPPAVPPPKYWSAKYQTCEGQEFIQDWYRGYQCGLAAADSHGYSQFNQVPVSPTAPTLNHSGCGQCYAPDRCNCPCGDAMLPFDVGSSEFSLSTDTVSEAEAVQSHNQWALGVGADASATSSPSDLATGQADNFIPPR